MGNDLKYGLVLGGVLILIFVGYVAMRGAGSGQESADTITSPETPITTEPDMFQPPQVPTSVSRPPQTAEIEISGAEEAETPLPQPGGELPAESHAPVMPGSEAAEIPEALTGLPPVGTAAAASEPGETTYVIQKGDVLTTISQKYYGTTRRWKDIADANKDVIPDPNRLKVGTEIVIPDIEASSAPTAPASAAASATGEPVSTARTHTVVKDDNLWSLAVAYYGDGNQWKKIYDANKDKIPNVNALKVGTELKIP